MALGEVSAVGGGLGRVDHLYEHVLRVTQTFKERGVCVLEVGAERVLDSLSLCIDEGNHSTRRRQNYFTCVEEYHLDDLIAQAEQDRLVASLPLLQIDQPGCIAGAPLRHCRAPIHCHLSGRFWRERLTVLLCVLPIKIRPEMLQESHLLLDILGVICQFVSDDMLLSRFLIVRELSRGRPLDVIKA